MKHRYLVPLCTLLLTQVIACMDKTPQTKKELFQDCVSTTFCPDKGTPSETSTLSIFGEAGAIWEHSFAYQYGITDSNRIPFYFSIPAQTLASFLLSYAGDSNYYDGLKVYFGLDTLVDSCAQVVPHLRLIVVPYKNNADMEFPPAIGPCITVDSAGTTPHVPQSTAEGFVANWRRHYETTEGEYMLPVAAYSFPRNMLWKQIDTAQQSEHDSTVYFMFGCHTITPVDEDSNYCVEKLRQTYGFVVVNLVIATRLTITKEWTRSSDFARPCPRFCGETLFKVYCPEE